ncbi:MAG: dienelactone hydrolase family protein [Ignavibacteriaceae bacterium]|nr:dienelactone hydrolase family protein [Ignavibacteriaceae bacterium]
MKIIHTIIFLLIILCAWINAQTPLFNNMPANGVLGQSVFTTNQSGTSSILLNSPSGVAVDPTTGKLFVADRYNNRILRWSTLSKMENGSPAEAVLGQSDLITSSSGISASKLNDPLRVFIDSTGCLWVSDYLNNRVLRFDNASSKPTGAPADGVLGQPDFNSNISGTSASKMKGPVGVFVDGKGRLWVADRLNHRVLRFDGASLKSNGAPADGVLGQQDFTTGTSGLSNTKMNRPMGVYLDLEDNLWVCEDDNNRAIRFDNVSSKLNGAAADGVLGQPDFNTNLKKNSRDGVSNLRGVYGDAAGRLYLVDESNHRVLVFNHAASKPNGAFADYVLGQPDFGSDPIIQQEVYDASTLNYLLFMPRDTFAAENGKYPLIISLHGIGERGNDLWKVKNEGLPKILDGKNDFEFIVVSPQCPSTTEWYYNDGIQEKLDKMIDSVINRYPVDTNRIYLTGLSMGGIGTLDLAIRYPKRFAALIPIAFRIEDGWDLCKIKDIPLWGFHGQKDDIIPISKAQSVINALNSCGGNPLFTIYPDLYHDSWTRTYNNPDIYTWLLTKRKQ